MQEPSTDPSETNAQKQSAEEITPTKARRRRILGIICLLGVVILWVGSSILMQYIFTDQNFNKPFFLTYLDTSLFTIYLLGFIFRRKKWMEIARAKPAENTSTPKSKPEEDVASLLPNNAEISPQTSKSSEMLNLKQVVILSLLFCPLWFVDNYTFNLSLALTSVSSNTILSSTSGLFTLILTVLMKVEKFNVIKLLGVLLTLGGVIMVSLSDTRNQGKDSIWGDVLALASAFTYALYVSLFKRQVKDEDKVDNGMFLGLFNMATLWPLIFILNVAKVETFVAPKGMVLLYLLLNSLFGTALSDYLWLQAVLLISPVAATVGLSLTIPVAMISDMLIKHTKFSVVYIFGSVFVAIGFVIVNVDNIIIDYVKKRWNQYKAINN